MARFLNSFRTPSFKSFIKSAFFSSSIIILIKLIADFEPRIAVLSGD
jgi:hypothetical protein